MEPALKQRLVGATVLVALAVVFLPMLIKGPAPESEAANVPLELPEAPQGRPGEGKFETRELPLLGPGAAPAGGAVGLPGAAPATSAPPADAAQSGATMTPAMVAAGDYAVGFGSYATSTDAARVIAALAAAQLPGYQEPVEGTDGRALHRVRIGPYATRAEAEAARLAAGKVNDKVRASVVTLDADVTPAASAASAAAATAASKPPVSQATPAASASVSAAVALPDTSAPAPDRPQPLASAQAKPNTTGATPAKPAVVPPKPAATTAAPTTTASAPARPAETPTPAAADVGFAVQLGAFGNAAEAAKLRDRVRAAGFGAFVETVNSGQGTLNRVRVGPVSSRAEADQLKAQVNGKLGTSGIVRPHP